MSTQERAGHKSWRKKVFERDNYTCKKCGEKGGHIEADHIKPWMLFPDIRFNISNGQTLCRKCHGKKTSLELKMYWKNQYGKSKSFDQIDLDASQCLIPPSSDNMRTIHSI